MKYFISKVVNILENFDLFSAPVMLRFKAQDDIKSKTGGCVSIILIIVLGATFYNSWLSLFNKSDIKCQFQYFRELSPSPLVVGSENFMLMVGFTNIKIQDKQNKYFDVQFLHQVRNHGLIVQSNKIEMIPCERRHFIKYGAQIESLYQKQNLKQFLCLPDNFSMTLQGKWSSEVFSYIMILINNCTVNCTTYQKFNDIMTQGGYFIDYFFINKLINPTSKSPITYYFQDKNYNVINDKIAIDTNLYLSQYQIQTDESLFPVESINMTTGFWIDRTQKEQIVHPILNGTYGSFVFRKSDQKIKIIRSYQKIDDLFSYLGGLLGILVGFFGIFLINYNKCCYQLEMFKKVFMSEDDNQSLDLIEFREAIHGIKGTILQPKQIKSDGSQINFNFFTFIKYSISKVFFIFFNEKHWKQMAMITERLEETQNQMNIDLILQKISFYERSLQCLFDQDQVTLLLLQEKISISQLKQQRMIMNFEDEQFLKNHINSQSSKSNKVSNSNFKQPDIVITQQKHEQEQQDSLMLGLYQSISSLRKKEKSGDLISKKILAGIREDLMKKFINFSNKNKNKNMLTPRRISNFSNFLKSSPKIIENLDNKGDNKGYRFNVPDSIMTKKILNNLNVFSSQDVSSESKSISSFR